MRRRGTRVGQVLGIFAVVAGLAAAPAFANAEPGGFATWLSGLRAEAEAKGIKAETLDAALKGLSPIPRVIELDRRQPEFTLTFDQYMARVVPAKRIAKARKKYRENKALLEKIGAKFGVQPRFIVAFWGIETDFGRVDGGFHVVQALATLAYDGRRSKYFRKELLNALTILDQGHIDADNMMGSWAGAMGQFQFMPSSFLNFAYDYDGDGRRDIWRNQGDAFASAANYLAKSGWRDDQTWGRPVKLPKGFDAALVDLKTVKHISEWQKLGVRRADGRDLPKRDLRASIVMADEKEGPAFMVYDNYRVTLKWNRSLFFAVAVGTLAERIRGG